MFLFRPLMVACANPKINLAELYSLIERLKNAPNPEEIFNAVNQENKVLFVYILKDKSFELIIIL